MPYADRNFPRPHKNCTVCGGEYRPTGARQVACGPCKSKRRKAMRQARIPLKIINCADCGVEFQKNGRQIRCANCQPNQLRATTYRWRSENFERDREMQRRSAKRNQGKHVIHSRARHQAIVIRAFAHERELVERVYEDRDLINRIFPHVKATVDHVVPLKNANVCGLHVFANLRVIPAKENLKKGNKFMENLVA